MHAELQLGVVVEMKSTEYLSNVERGVQISRFCRCCCSFCCGQLWERETRATAPDWPPTAPQLDFNEVGLVGKKPIVQQS